MAGQDRDAHAGARDPQVGDAEDLAALVAELLLLVGLERPVVDDRPGERQHVEGDRRDVLVRRGEVDGRPVVHERGGLLHGRAELSVELLDPGHAAAGHGLVGAGHDADQPGGVVQRLEHRHRRHRGAVGVGDDALADLAERVRVDLADDQRHVRVHPPGGGVVDDRGAGGGEHGRQPPAGGRTRAEDRQVEPAGVGGRGVLDDDLPVADPQGRARGAGAREQPHLLEGEVALGQQPEHDRTHLPGGAHDAQADACTCGAAHRPVPP